MSQTHNPLNSRDTLSTMAGDLAIFRLDRLETDGVGAVSRFAVFRAGAARGGAAKYGWVPGFGRRMWGRWRIGMRPIPIR